MFVGSVKSLLHCFFTNEHSVYTYLEMELGILRCLSEKY